jgi:murein DD-endopeptidase MepM/ murein hydrolase activator NlpD
MYEVQFHPADIRKQVRYLFLSRRTARWVMAVGAVVGLVIVTGMALAPLGVRSLLVSTELRALRYESQMLNDVLLQRATTLERLERRVAAARNRQQQMTMILGAPQESSGLGGYPEPMSREIRLPEAALAERRANRLQTESKALLALSDDLARFVQEHHELTRTVPSICPLPIGSFVLTSPFGDRISPFTNERDFHAGIDLAAREGTKVEAPGDGRVVFAGRFPLRRNVRWWRYGNVVVLAHGSRYLTIFAHLEDLLVRRGRRVKRGEIIGTVGSTGWSTSPHLHYEVRVRDRSEQEPVPVDPRIYILNYEWKGQEALLAASRGAPRPAFDPLPSLVRTR